MGFGLDGVTEARVGRDAAGDGDVADAGFFGSPGQLLKEDVDDGLLEGGSQVGFILLNEPGIFPELVAQEIEEICFESAEAVVESGYGRFGEGEAVGVALFGQLIDVGAAGVRKAHHLGALVEGLTGGVVDGLADDLHVEMIPDQDDLGVSARDEEAEERKGRHAVDRTRNNSLSGR